MGEQLKPLRIKEDSLFWKLYKLRFELENKAIPKPTYICPYFWTAVYGARLWLYYKVPLKKMWATWILSFLVLVGVALLSPYLGDYLGTVLIMGSAFIWFAINCVAVICTMGHINDTIERYFKKRDFSHVGLIFSLLGLVGFFGVIIYTIGLGNFWSLFIDDFKATWNTSLYYLMVLLTLLIAALFFILGVFFPKYFTRLMDTFITIGAFIKAKYHRICPPVEPPATFKEKEENETPA